MLCTLMELDLTPLLASRPEPPNTLSSLGNARNPTLFFTLFYILSKYI